MNDLVGGQFDNNLNNVYTTTNCNNPFPYPNQTIAWYPNYVSNEDKTGKSLKVIELMMSENYIQKDISSEKLIELIRKVANTL